MKKRSNGELDMQFFGSTLLSKELEVMNAVKSGNIAMGSPAGAAATIFPEMGAFLVPYLVQSYDQAYKMFNGAIGDKLDKQFQEKYKVKTMCFFDYGFRHFWTSKKAISEPRDLRGAKIRVQQAKVFGDTINGLGGNAVPMAWGEVISAAKQGVIDGGDRRQCRRRQEGARAQGHDRGRSQGRGLQEDCAAEGLAGLQVAVRRAVGRDREREGLTGVAASSRTFRRSSSHCC